MSTLFLQLTGGLGNQMFQYAAGLALSRSLGMQLALDYVGSACDTPRNYELGRLQVEACLAEQSAVARFLAAPSRLARIGRRLLPSCLRPSAWQPQIVRENGFPWQPIDLDPSRDAYMTGYWQTERYFSDIAHLLRTQFTPAMTARPATLALLAAIRGDDAVSVHVRRGDYASNPQARMYHGVLGPEYYRAAVTRIEALGSGWRYYVFSDDPAWVRAELRIGVPFLVVDRDVAGAPEWDLVLMAACRHHVIANSTFSWWGAWLDPRPDKRVVAPRRWFAGPNAPDTRDLVPAHWLRV